MGLAVLLLAGCTQTLTQAETAGAAAGANTLQLDAKNARVVLMPLDIELSQISAAGLEEPKADWTETARGHVTAALSAALGEHGLALGLYVKPKDAKRARRDDQLDKLHSTVGGTIITHHYTQQYQLPTKRGRMEWTLGDTAREMGKDQKADFALFVFLRDSYGTGGRKAAMVFNRMLGGAMTSGERIAFASLVDLRNGDIVWFNILYSDSGDLREAAPARVVIDDLLGDFPI